MVWIGLLLSCGVGAFLGMWMIPLADLLRENSEGYERIISRTPSAERRMRVFMACVGAGVFALAWQRAGASGLGALVWGGLILWWTWLLFLAVLDARFRVLPVELLVVAGLIGFFLRWCVGGVPFHSLLLGGMVGLLFFGAQAWLSRGRLMGMGDPLMAMMIGLVVGWPIMATVIYLSYMLVIPLLFIQWIRVGTMRRVRWPFAPLLATGTILASVVGERLVAYVVG